MFWYGFQEIEGSCSVCGTGGEVQGGYFANYLHYFLLFHYFYYSTILHSDALLMTTALGVAGRHIGVGAYLYVGVVTPKYKQK